MVVPLLVSPEWLAGHLDDSGIQIADARRSLIEKDKGPNAHLQGDIPGSMGVSFRA